MKGDVADSASRIQADICIVGSGVAGAIVAQEVLDAGRTVVMIEAGRRTNGRAFGLRMLERAVHDYRIPRMRLWHRRATYARSESTGRGYRLNGRALMVRGGSTLGWSGDAYRMRPEDFKLASSVGIGLDWPVTYEDLERYYSKAETTIAVAGDESDHGHPPRTVPFPIAPLPFHERDAPFSELMADTDATVMHHNVSLSPDGSAFTADRLIDGLELRPRFTILLRTAARRLLAASRDRAAAVECWDTTRDRLVTVEADQFVLCAGGIETPGLLLRSTNRWWVEGLGNASGHVGRNLVSHSGVAIGGRPRGFRLFDGPIVPTAASRHFDTEEFQHEGKFLLIWRPAPSGLVFLNAISEQFSDPSNMVLPGSGVTRFGTATPYVSLHRDERLKARQESIGQQLDSFASRMNLKIHHRRSFLLAHPMCATRMSLKPEDGVLDADMRVHSVQNVYVCGSSSFTSGGAANPTMTIAALAHRLGSHLA